jgi:competence ComEA-like helix-hairpin-helix protein
MRCRLISRQGMAVVLSVAILSHAVSTAAKKTPPAHPIDINTATAKQLEQLPGVGPTTAKAIIEFRTKAGRFQRVTDLLVIRGISETKLKKMRPYITIGPSAKKPAPPSTRPPASPAPPQAH